MMLLVVEVVGVGVVVLLFVVLLFGIVEEVDMDNERRWV